MPCEPTKPPAFRLQLEADPECLAEFLNCSLALALSTLLTRGPVILHTTEQGDGLDLRLFDPSGAASAVSDEPSQPPPEACPKCGGPF